MFPKFLRVVTAKSMMDPEIVNGTIKSWKKSVYSKDRKPLDVVADALGFTYEMVFALDGDGFGERLPNGSWTKALGMLQRREADLVFGFLGATDERHEAFRLSSPHSVEEVTFITKKHEYVANPVIFLHAFSIELWISISACLCLVPFAFHYLLRRKHSAVKLFTSTLSTLVAQGINLSPQGTAEYFVLACWILSGSLLYYFYLSVLLSFLTFPSMQGIRTIEDLANGIEDGIYYCATYDNADYSYVLSKQRNSSFEVIGNRLAENPTYDYFIEFLNFDLSKKKLAFIGHRSEFLPYKEFYFVSEENFFSTFFTFATRKDFCCGSELDNAIHRIRELGIFQKFAAEDSFYNFLLNFYLESENWFDPPLEDQLTMTVLKGPFMFLIAPLSLSILIFLIEVCVKKLKSCSIFSKV